jgi:hypothetical protein
LAGSFTSLAITENPLLGSPARRFDRRVENEQVCLAIDVITLMTLLIATLESPKRAICRLVFSAILTAVATTRAAFVELLAISRILHEY